MKDVEGVYEQFARRLAEEPLQRPDLVAISSELQLLMDRLERMVSAYTGPAGGTQQVLLSRRAVDEMGQILRWFQRYSFFAPEAELHARLLAAQKEASTVLTALKQLGDDSVPRPG